MFADFLDRDFIGAAWGVVVSLYPWFLRGAAVAVVAVAVMWGIRWLHRDGHIGVVAGHVRRLLMKRTTASPTPPPAEANEAPLEAEPQREEEPAPEAVEEPAPTMEAPTPPAPEAPALPDAPMEEAPAWVTKALIGIAAVPTLLALPWAAWSVAHLLPVPLAVALPLGVLFDVAMVGAVLVALLVPSVSRQASVLGWVASTAAAAAITVHVGLSGALVFAATPLISKALWGLLVTIRRQQAALVASRKEAERRKREADEEAARRKEEAEEEARAEREAEEARRAAELSTELSFEQQAEIARLERDALYAEQLAAAELKLSLAKSDAEHQKALAEIKRLGEQQRAEDKEEAEVYEQRLRLERKLRTIHGQTPRFAVEAGMVEAEIVPEIVPVGVTNKAGFGSGFGFQRPLDVKALTPEGASVRFEELPETHQALVKYVKVEKEPTIRGASRKLDRDPRTIRRWKEDLAELGYDLPIGK